VRENLFNTWYNGILTLICLVVIAQVLSGVISWIFGAAKWTVIQTNLRLFFVGRFPPDLYWRLWTSAAIIAGVAALSWGNATTKQNTRPWSRSGLIALGVTVAAVVFLPIALTARLWLLAIIIIAVVGYQLGRQLDENTSRWLPLAWGLSFVVFLWFLKGGLGLESTPTSVWTGLLLTIFTAVISIVLSFPIGVLLALGRQSSLPVVRWLSILYIELIRGLPLIGILFLAQVMLPLFLPPQFTRLDRVLRAIAGLILFNAAYMAENVRGGLQAIPREQTEAGSALGLSTPLVLSLIVLPQALRAVIPALVGEFIGLFKDTSLLSLFGLLELTGIARSILAQPQFLGRYAEVYLFIGLIYWVFCYGMSLASQRLERKLNIGQD
jgi:general L-amino acid transport system permease protein